MTQLAMDFKDRKVMKTYTAVLSGDIKAPDASSISASAAKQLGVSIENGARSEWQLIDEELEGERRRLIPLRLIVAFTLVAAIAPPLRRSDCSYYLEASEASAARTRTK